MATTKLLLLRDTLVIWGGEFGRRPCAQIADGREHTKLTYRHAGRDLRLTETNGKVVPETPLVSSRQIALRGDLASYDPATAIAKVLVPERDATVLRWLKPFER